MQQKNIFDVYTDENKITLDRVIKYTDGTVELIFSTEDLFEEKDSLGWKKW